MAGGEDADFADPARRDRLLPAKIARIAKKLGVLMPGIDPTPEMSWTASFGDSATSLPAIGPVPGAERCFAVLGFGGNGITFSAIAAQVIQRAVLGLPDPDAELSALA